LTTEELCTPVGVDTDDDGLDDGCDPCPENADCDADGFCDGLEVYLGTDPLDNCSDDPTDDAWPLDINNDAIVNLGGDVNNYAGKLGCSVATNPECQRLDINGDGVISLGGDLSLYVGMMGASCADTAPGETIAQAGGWCWACIEWPVGTLDLHIHGEFNWTIPIPLFPDLVDTKYEMHMWVSFTWLNQLNIAGLGSTYAWAEADSPYYINMDPLIIATPSGGFSQWNVEARVTVEVFPWITQMAYPVSLWIDFWIPGIWSPGGSGFHYWWAHVEWEEV
jgi:hypothetical protein